MTVERWRTLAVPTYAVGEFGAAVQFPAGTKVRAFEAHDIDPETGVGVRMTHDPSTVIVEADPDDQGVNRLWHVTGSAMVFEPEREAER